MKTQNRPNRQCCNPDVTEKEDHRHIAPEDELVYACALCGLELKPEPPDRMALEDGHEDENDGDHYDHRDGDGDDGSHVLEDLAVQKKDRQFHQRSGGDVEDLHGELDLGTVVSAVQDLLRVCSNLSKGIIINPPFLACPANASQNP
ncbi:hypothetical protein ASPACDRAFT_123291 [Aspergillus aculeatus ATCC 16872]|uniref:Uncharacterized protein n=1 Tax=Aspergillus aculeatus (strain ATCC 16872 / CBS 172.66 / WB 5094) TaxID=690307 RepID=A0A1L9WMP6_ASPA1|nr:uncharacterized protein ASPACDRAFT_123291 [Aspergillus aculeatus ATCC 16872]OJJ97424.1 hypothetical protein ASPACDRAFT_123291 [Aspergillus aculeatus ATCC 16872]